MNPVDGALKIELLLAWTYVFTSGVLVKFWSWFSYFSDLLVLTKE